MSAPEENEIESLEADEESLLQRVSGFLEGMGEECRGELDGAAPPRSDLIRILHLLGEGLLGMSKLVGAPAVYFQVLQAADAKGAGLIADDQATDNSALCANLAHTLEGQPNKLELLLALQAEIQQQINRAYGETEKTETA